MATGAKAVDGLAWMKPKPVFSSSGATVLRLQSLSWTSSLMQRSAASGEAPMGTSPVTTPNSPSKSMPAASSRNGTSWQAPRKSSEPPWYISGASEVCGSTASFMARDISRPWARKAEASSHW